MRIRSRFSWTVPALVALAVLVPAGEAGAASRPAAEAIVRFDAGVAPTARRAAVRAVGGRVVRDLHIIRGLGVRLPAGAAARLARTAGVEAVTPNAAVRPSDAGPAAWDANALATAFVQSTRADKLWSDSNSPATGAGVTVAVIDTG